MASLDCWTELYSTAISFGLLMPSIALFSASVMFLQEIISGFLLMAFPPFKTYLFSFFIFGSEKAPASDVMMHLLSFGCLV